jgi:hypothetical protein
VVAQTAPRPVGRLDRHLLGLAIALHLAITVPLAWLLNAWLDESYTLHTTGQGIAYAFDQAIHFELQPPLYFVLLAVWRLASHTIFWARLFSVACTSMTIYATWELSRRFAKTINPAWAAFVVALNPAAVWAATEIRVYAFAALLGALLVWTFYDGFIAEAPRARLLHAILIVAAIYTQYFLGFIVAGLIVALALTYPRMVKIYAVYLVGAAIFCLPVLSFIAAQIREGTAQAHEIRSAWAVASGIYGTALSYVLPFTFRHIGPLSLLIVLAACILGLRKPELRLSWWIAAVSLVLLWAGMAATREIFAPRYVFTVFVPVVMGLVTFLASLPAARLWFAVYSLAFVAASVASMRTTYAPMAKEGDWARVAAYITAREKPGEPIVVFPGPYALPFELYYHGPNPVVPLPEPQSFDWHHPTVVTLSDTRQIDEALRRIEDSLRKQIWFIQVPICHYGSRRYGCAILAAYISNHFTVTQTRTFLGAHVSLLSSVRTAGRHL